MGPRPLIMIALMENRLSEWSMGDGAQGCYSARLTLSAGRRVYLIVSMSARAVRAVFRDAFASHVPRGWSSLFCCSCVIAENKATVQQRECNTRDWISACFCPCAASSARSLFLSSLISYLLPSHFLSAIHRPLRYCLRSVVFLGGTLLFT